MCNLLTNKKICNRIVKSVNFGVVKCRVLIKQSRITRLCVMKNIPDMDQIFF